MLWSREKSLFPARNDTQAVQPVVHLYTNCASPPPPRYSSEDNIKMDGFCLASSGSGLGPVVGSCEHGDEPSGSVKCSEFLE
jgi:hypothetical protein